MIAQDVTVDTAGPMAVRVEWKGALSGTMDMKSEEGACSAIRVQ
jgi:hypothetical protein